MLPVVGRAQSHRTAAVGIPSDLTPERAMLADTIPFVKRVACFFLCHTTQVNVCFERFVFCVKIVKLSLWTHVQSGFSLDEGEPSFSAWLQFQNVLCRSSLSTLPYYLHTQKLVMPACWQVLIARCHPRDSARTWRLDVSPRGFEEISVDVTWVLILRNSCISQSMMSSHIS